MLENTVEQMGDVEAAFGPSIARIIGLSVGCIITTILGLLCFTPFYISWQQGGQIPTIAYLALLLGAPLFVVAISAFSCLFAMVRYRFFFCSEGIAHNLNGTVVSCRWDFIAEVKEEAFISSWLHPAYGLRYIIQMKDGREPLIVDVYVNRTAKFRRLMNEEVARRGIPWINVPDPFLHPVARKCPQCANTGPEHKNRASFEREGGASWAGEGNGDVSARTGGTARHAGRSAESGLAGCCGLTQDGAALSASRSRPMNRTRAVGTTAERFV
jgi:hypothetical protein